jgi:hypothetical protein
VVDPAGRDRLWRAEFESVLGRTGDIVAALSAVRASDPMFAAQQVRAAAVVRDVLGLSIRQLHLVAGWLAGNIADDLLYEQVLARRDAGPAAG